MMELALLISLLVGYILAILLIWMLLYAHGEASDTTIQ